MGDTYTCADCGGTFEAGWSDDEANAEALEVFGIEKSSQHPGMDVVCDDCYRAIMESDDLMERN